jgi:hypothetical protein
MRRIAEKRARLPANSVKRLSPLVAAPKSRLIEDQPDYPDDAA